MGKKSRKKQYKQISKGKKRGKKYLVKPKIINIRRLMAAFVIWLLIMAVILSFFFSVTRIRGYGMIPNFRDKDIVLLNKRKPIKRFDVVQCELGRGKNLLRVIGLPGDKVAYKHDELFINDEQIDEKHLIREINEARKNSGVYTEDFTNQLLGDSLVVPVGSYILLGDNRKHTNDSRLYGYVTSDQIKGVVVYRLFPFVKEKHA